MARPGLPRSGFFFRWEHINYNFLMSYRSTSLLLRVGVFLASVLIAGTSLAEDPKTLPVSASAREIFEALEADGFHGDTLSQWTDYRNRPAAERSALVPRITKALL